MEVDIRNIHHGEHDRQRQRNGQRDDGPWPSAQAREAADEDDDDCLPERGHEIVDRDVDADGLIRDQRRLDAVRQVGADVRHFAADVAAQRQDVASVAHGDGEADRGLAIDAEHRLRRIGKTAPHRGNVAQSEDAIADDKIDRLDVALRIEGAADAQEHALLCSLDGTRRPHEILRLQRRKNCLVVKAQSGQALGRELDEDSLILRAENFDFRHIGNVQQARTRRFDIIAQLAEAEAIGGKGIDDAEGAAEVVVETRPDDTGRQRTAHVADVLAHLIPDVGHLVRRRQLLQIDENRCLAGRGVAAHAVEIVGFLNRSLKTFRYLIQGFLDRRARPGSADHHRPEGKGRVLATSESLEGECPGDHRDDHQEDDQRAVGQRPFRQIRADHCCVSSRRTF